MAGAVRVLCRRDIRGPAKVRGSTVSGLVGRRGATGNLTGIDHARVLPRSIDCLAFVNGRFRRHVAVRVDIAQ